MRKNVFVIGAGQLGSRHLQALKSVSIPLKISVVDPSPDSLSLSKERYEGLPEIHNHEINYCATIPPFKKVDLAIIASNSDTRRSIIEGLLSGSQVDYMVLEKILFNKKEDYLVVAGLLRENKVKAWVDCSMRTMPFYHGINSYFGSEPFVYTVTGSQYGLVTNSIHYIDHMAFLSGCLDYELDTSMLDLPAVPSKRKGFLELNGTLSVKFSHGCQGSFTCFADGSLPVMLEIMSPKARIVSREWEGKAWVSEAKENWAWKEIEAKIPYQSQMTAMVVEAIFRDGSSHLVEYSDSMKLHIPLLERLKDHLNRNSRIKYDHYPFT